MRLLLALALAAAPARAFVHPEDFAVRITNELFQTQAIKDFERESFGDKVKDLDMRFTKDGIRVKGVWKTPAVLPNVSFGVLVPLEWVGNDQFDLKIRDFEIGGIPLGPFVELVFKAVQGRLSSALNGACRFDYRGKVADGTRAVRVAVDMEKLIPAFPRMRLTSLKVTDEALMFKTSLPRIGDVPTS